MYWKNIIQDSIFSLSNSKPSIMMAFCVSVSCYNRVRKVFNICSMTCAKQTKTIDIVKEKVEMIVKLSMFLQ